MKVATAPVTEVAVEKFLAGQRIALIGASADPRQFSATVMKELMAHGYDVVPVNPAHPVVAGVLCCPRIAAAGHVDGAIVMVPSDRSAQVVRECIAAGVKFIWLFKGVGVGSTSAEATELCNAAGVELVDGACPLMFLEPTGWIHRIHHSIRRVRGDVVVD